MSLIKPQPSPEPGEIRVVTGQTRDVLLRALADEPHDNGVARIASRRDLAAQDGATSNSLPTQAMRALYAVPTPALVVIQTIDNDIRCDGTDTAHIHDFGASVADALEVIASASPQARILVIGQIGRPSVAYIEHLVAADPSVKASLTGTGMCDSYDPAGELVEAHFEALTTIIDGYEAEQARVCAAVPHCRTDDGALAPLVDDVDLLSSDWNHLNRRGLARVAETIWPTVSRLLESA